MNKRGLALFLAAAALLFAAACGGRRNAETGNTTVFCTTYPAWLVARTLMEGTGNKPELLISADAGCPHDFALTAAELRKFSVKKNLLLLRNGGGLDDRIAASLRTVNSTFRDVPAVENAHDGHEHGGDCRHDPHIFTAPGSLRHMVQTFADALIQFAPADKEIYQKNREKLLAELDVLAKEAAGIGQGQKIIAMHNTFRNLMEETGFQLRAVVFDGHISALSPAELAKLIALVKREKISLLLTEPQIPEQAVKQIQTETGIRVIALDPAATGKTDVSADYLLNRIRENIRILKENAGGAE